MSQAGSGCINTGVVDMRMDLVECTEVKMPAVCRAPVDWETDKVSEGGQYRGLVEGVYR